jgi:UDP-N-acetylmuramoyl-tripeptide--D-alanyl-D-alanine ligase
VDRARHRRRHRGTASGDFSVSGIEIDSRAVAEGDLFFALKGEAADGHRFLEGAFGRGAQAAVVDRDVPWPHVRVADTFRALEDLGAPRARVDAGIIGVTGSAGKTRVKEALYAALDRGSRGRAHRSVKSYNNHVGVPLSLARMPARTRFGVFEMGMNHAGELSALTRLVRPHVAIVTTIAPAHIGHFSGEEAIADAKGEIFEGLEPGGTAIVPADSPHYARLRAKAERHAARVLGFGVSREAQVRLIDAVPAPAGEWRLARHRRSRHAQAVLHHGHAGRALGRQFAGGDGGGRGGRRRSWRGRAGAGGDGRAGRARRAPSHSRAARRWIGQALLIDESYNANPASMRATILQLGPRPRAADRRAGGDEGAGRRRGRYHRELAGR